MTVVLTTVYLVYGCLSFLFFVLTNKLCKCEKCLFVYIGCVFSFYLESEIPLVHRDVALHIEAATILAQ